QGAPAAATTSATPQAEYATERLHIQTPAEQAALHDLQPTLAPAAAQVQAANSLEATQAAAAAGGERLSARVGTNAWENQVGQKIVWMAAGGDQSAELTLNPPDLGPMQVVLSVSNDQASVAFTAAQPEVRAALESALPRLKEMMSESGLSLGNATVNAGNPGQQDQQQRMAGNAAGQGQGNGNRYGNDNGNAPAAVNEVQPNAPRTQRLDRGLVDLFA
ncbi:flagellar hook-length control protein FliK, partial [Massilia arenosa]